MEEEIQILWLIPYILVPTTWTPPFNAMVTLETWLLVTLYKLHLLIYFMCVQTHVTVLLCRSKDNLRGLVLSLHSVDSRVQTQVSRLSAVILWAMSPAHWWRVLKWWSREQCGAYALHTLCHVVSRTYAWICWNTSFLFVLRKSGCSETDSGQRHGCQMGVAFEQLGW